MDESISAAFPYPSHWAEVKGSRMHYVEQGSGDPILLVHGNPTSSYLWRNVIPRLSALGRCIAPDLMGMGRSDKPDIGYRVLEHADYLEGFIEALGLRNVRLVLHDWGGFMGFRYAARQPGNVRAIAFMEAVVKSARMSERSEAFQRTFGMLRGPKGLEKIMKENFFVERILPGSVMRKLTDEEMGRYREPFLEEASRKPTYVFPNDIPLDGHPADVTAAVEAFGFDLDRVGIPMLLLTFTPGAIILPPDVAWCRQQFPTLSVREMGRGIHFVQEDQPEAIGQAIADWLRTLG